MLYTQSINGCLAETVAARGIDEAALASLAAELPPHISWLRKASLPALMAAGETADLPEITRFTREIAAGFEKLVILGTGGSSLCGAALAGFNANSGVEFIANIDPFTLSSLMKRDLSRTAFLAISKSGNTLETMAQSFLILDLLKSRNLNPSRHFFVIASPGENPLRKLASELGVAIMDHHPHIGGRYSIFSLVGLIPAAVAGLDVAKIRAGAKSVLSALAPDSPPAIGAALNVAFMRKGVINSVLMPYTDRLAAFAQWHRQVWAESLGKNGAGSTPIPALGAIDQHSQLQLYLDGPKDKLFTFIACDNRGGEKIKAHGEFSYLNGKTAGDIITACQEATIMTLGSNKIPARVIRLSSLNEETLGALAMHMILETILAAKLLGIDPFDQPAVEEGKILAKKLLENS